MAAFALTWPRQGDGGHLAGLMGPFHSATVQWKVECLATGPMLRGMIPQLATFW